VGIRQQPEQFRAGQLGAARFRCRTSQKNSSRRGRQKYGAPGADARPTQSQNVGAARLTRSYIQIFSFGGDTPFGLHWKS
jgi:hypothetical protein